MSGTGHRMSGKKSSSEVLKKKHRPRRRTGTSSRLSLGYDVTSERAAKRVIAPFVNIMRKGRKAAVKKEADDAHFMFYLKKKPSVLTRHMTEFLDETVDLQTLIYETAETLRSITNSAGIRMYLVDASSNTIYIATRQATQYLRRICWKIEKGKSVAAHVACTKEHIIIKDICADPRFEDGIPYTDAMVKSVLCVPVVTPAKECYAVIELFRDIMQKVFRNSDLEIAVAVASWMGAAIHMNQERLKAGNQQQLNDCLVELTKCFFSDIHLFDKMIMEIVSLAKSSLNAERATVYVIDTDRDELVADIFDEGTEQCDDITKRNMKLRFGKERGIARHVATTGESLNIKDAFNDPRFQQEIDEKTGRITRSIMAMPVKTYKGVVGVVQVINKLDGPCFTKHDEEIFHTFSVYCAMALHYSVICKINRRAEAKCDVCLGLVKRHVFPCDHDVQHLRANLSIYENPVALRTFSWYINIGHMDQMPQVSIYMINEIAGEEAIDQEELIKFVLCMRNFYRPQVTYHNWEHGFNVCHCMYNLILRNRFRFSENEQKGLIVACLAHDLDHGGVTNNFLVNINDVMAQLYEVSIWESHHYATLMNVLTQIHIFKDISNEDFNEISDVMRQAILSTDLAYYFRIRQTIMPIIMEERFSWGCKEHKSMAMSIMMTVCDLSGQCKPFSVAKRLTENLYTEFYAQGDREKEMGFKPLTLMDRDKEDVQPDDQVTFLDVLVIPCADMIKRILYDSDGLYNGAMELRKDWVDIITIRDMRCWKPAESIVQK